MAANDDPGVTDKQRILVADDEKEIREMLKMLLACELPDCRLQIAVNGEEVIDAFREAHPAVIVLDIRMPKLTGEEAFYEIMSLCETQQWELPAFVFVTGYDVPKRLEQVVATDERHCILRKPVDDEQLVVLLRERLDLQADAVE